MAEMTKEDEKRLANKASEARYDLKCFKGLPCGKTLSALQKKFVVVFLDPPNGGKWENRHKAFSAVFNPSNDNSMKANCSKLMAMPKVKEAIVAYQKYMIMNNKISVSQQSIEALKKMAFYEVSDFFENNGDPKPLDNIDSELIICIENIKVEYRGAKADTKVVHYQLTDRNKARAALNDLLGISETMKTISMQADVPVEAVNDKGKKGSGPAISMNITVGNPNKK